MSADQLHQVTLYTDGACHGNPGPGGYAAVLIYEDGARGSRHRKELQGGFALTTNNRMEIMAAIAGLEALKEACHITLYSDSRYLVDAVSKGWAARWRKNGWWRNKTERAVNPDLWERLIRLCERHQVELRWVRGHAGNSENERCDQLAEQAANQRGLPHDPGYRPDRA